MPSDLKPDPEDRQPPRKRFVQETFDMGMGPDFPGDKMLAFADALEDEEIMRELAQGK